MAEYLFSHNANTHWAYPTSEETDEMLARARAALGDFLGVTGDEIAFGANMTTLTFHLARAIGRDLRAGDQIVVTELDHHANLAPWTALARERGAVIRTVPFDTASGTLDRSALAAAVTGRTRVIAIGAASNALGTITDVSVARELASRSGALVFVDAVHYAPHELVDARALGCDFLACSAYKFYGPHIGVLYARHASLARLDLPRLEPAPSEPPESLETGTQNHEGIAGAAAAVDWIAGLAASQGTRRARLREVFKTAHARGAALLEKMWHGLAEIDGVRLYGPPPGQPRTPTLAFTVKGTTTEQVARHLAACGVFASNGDFYASTVAERYDRGSDGFVRAGCAIYTTDEEVERLLKGVRSLKR
jgi:cysteine desulfurase family protein (TIGR01976 family)